jgi:t-SNARE complex subunit (syntaxin)
MQILTDNKPADIIENTYINMNDKYNSILELESNITELNKMFIDLALLVDLQGEMLDSIDINIKNSSKFFDEAKI